MKFVFIMFVTLFSVASYSSNLEIAFRQEMYDSNEGILPLRTRCLLAANEIETNAFKKIKDTTFAIRYSKTDALAMGLVTCYLGFFDSEKTSFAQETQSFEVKKCNEKAQAIEAEANVVWVSFSNNVRIQNGSKGCKVNLVRATTL